MTRNVSDKNVQNISLERKEDYYQQQIKGNWDDNQNKTQRSAAESGRVKGASTIMLQQPTL